MTRASVAAAVVMMVLAAFDAGSEPAGQPATHSPSIADAMIMIQIRHAKLWLAGEARNWALADYEVEELEEGLEDVMNDFPVYKDMPVGKMIEATIMSPLGEVEKAIKARDHAGFVRTFDALTQACNNCHVATNRAFIVIQRPASSPFPNQSFAPRRD